MSTESKRRAVYGTQTQPSTIASQRRASCLTPIALLCLLNDGTCDADVAADLGLLPGTFSKLKTGRLTPAPQLQRRLCAYFHLPAAFDFTLPVEKSALRHLLGAHFALKAEAA